MNVNSASSAINLWKLLEASQTTSTSTIASSTGTTDTGSVTGTSSDGSALSGVAKLFSKLELLSKSNPAEFKKITSQIASQLQAAAKDSSDPGQASALNQLASNFQKASASGNFSDLFQQSGNGDTVSQLPHAGGHHHHYQANGDSSFSSSGSTADPLSAIFSNALMQLGTDLQSATTSTTTQA